MLLLMIDVWISSWDSIFDDKNKKKTHIHAPQTLLVKISIRPSFDHKTAMNFFLEKQSSSLGKRRKIKNVGLSYVAIWKAYDCAVVCELLRSLA